MTFRQWIVWASALRAISCMPCVVVEGDDCLPRWGACSFVVTGPLAGVVFMRDVLLGFRRFGLLLG
jgi:hypothetical protein